MRKIWWTWDIRMRWVPDFSFTADSYELNYMSAVDAAAFHGVEGIVVWGFLRDRHGGVESAKRICEYARKKDVNIIPGFGVDAYGGAYYDGVSPYSLDNYLEQSPSARAVDFKGHYLTHRWPPMDPGRRLICCPSNKASEEYYIESVEWLIKTFDLKGLQIEQGDSCLCQCEKCVNARMGEGHEVICERNTDLYAAVARMSPVVEHALKISPGITVITETYSGIRPSDIERISGALEYLPDETYVSWQAYTRRLFNRNGRWESSGEFLINENSISPKPHGCIAIRTNSDAALGEKDDSKNIEKAIILARKAGLDMSYIYGEYPDSWPVTKKVYEAWSAACSDSRGKL